ncbi:MAG: CsbD family protein [Kiritimatiellia bacterium]
MKGSAKAFKGRIEEAAGVLSDNNALRTRGRADQAEGQAKKNAEKDVKHARIVARNLVDKAKDDAQDAVHKAERRD